MRAFVVALLTAGMYLLVGCGGQQQEQKPAEQPKTEQTQPAAPAAEPAPAPASDAQGAAADTAKKGQEKK
ncbi:MAG: hypothetical protein ABDH66_03135 [Bacteroidia bacterium]